MRKSGDVEQWRCVTVEMWNIGDVEQRRSTDYQFLPIEMGVEE